VTGQFFSAVLLYVGCVQRPPPPISAQL
jgi:hypothetical protein